MNSSCTSSSPELNFQDTKPSQPPCHTTASLKTIFDEDESHSFARESTAIAGFQTTTPHVTNIRQPIPSDSIPDVDYLSTVSDHSNQVLSQSHTTNLLGPLMWYPNISQSPPEYSSFEKVRAEIVEVLSPMSKNESSGGRQRHNLEGAIGAPTSYYEQIKDNGNQPPSYPNAQNLPNVDVTSACSNFVSMNVIPENRPAPSKPAAHVPRNNARHAVNSNFSTVRSPVGNRGVGKKRTSSASSSTCSICGKTYTESSNLSKHFRTVHLKLRPFQCHLCPSSFAEKNKLGKHIQSVHEHARPFKCDLCNATFSQASDRKRHRLVLHEGCRPYICDVCGKAFGRRSSLTQHSQRVHKMLGMSLAASGGPSLRNRGVGCGSSYPTHGFKQVTEVGLNDNAVLVQPLETPLISPSMQSFSRVSHLMLPVSSPCRRNDL